MKRESDRTRAATEHALRAKILELRDHGSRDEPGWPLWIVQAEGMTATTAGRPLRINAPVIRAALAAGALHPAGPEGEPHQVDSREFAIWAAAFLTEHHRVLFPEVPEP